MGGSAVEAKSAVACNHLPAAYDGGVLDVVDGASPLGVETEADIAWRKDLLRKFGYKL
jgi:adenosine/AMP kinase